MNKNKNIHTFIGFDKEYKDADIIVFGAPFDGTASFRPGTRFAPSVMRNESYGLETYSPYFDKDLVEVKICDVGDLDIFPGDTSKALKGVREFAAEVVKDGKIPLMIGGEHLVTYPAVESVFKKHNDLRVLHFDAHTDLREIFLNEELSHATVLKRIWDFVGDDRIYQYAIRSGSREEFEWAKKHTHLTKFNCEGLDEAINQIKDAPVYVTIDIDALDPSVVPGTGTPEPGGLTFGEMMDVILKLNRLNIVGADLVELSPHYDASGASSAVACKLLRELALAISK